ncbi:hypothetical protein AB0H45_13170 [Streptomyces atroolivaceus]|uniref:Uncharacterized protein n=1 Tax=Streptomyces atroolivaceus TaxID=66869 RepID=A0ABV9VFP8_STRAZ|nr:hypothetical protein [Streptomyces atroolivaceus]
MDTRTVDTVETPTVPAPPAAYMPPDACPVVRGLPGRGPLGPAVG